MVYLALLTTAVIVPNIIHTLVLLLSLIVGGFDLVTPISYALSGDLHVHLLVMVFLCSVFAKTIMYYFVMWNVRSFCDNVCCDDVVIL